MFLIKRAENTLYITWIHTNTGITHADHQIQCLFLDHHLTEGDDDLTFGGEFYGIGKEVDDHLIQTQFITNHIIHCNIFKINRITDISCFQVLGKHIVQALTHTIQTERFVLQLYLACLNT